MVVGLVDLDPLVCGAREDSTVVLVARCTFGGSLPLGNVEEEWSAKVGGHCVGREAADGSEWGSEKRGTVLWPLDDEGAEERAIEYTCVGVR